MDFAFEHIHNGVTRNTSYSLENQARIRDAFNNNEKQVMVYHLMHQGEFVGFALKHFIDLVARTVTNTQSGAIYRLILTIP